MSGMNSVRQKDKHPVHQSKSAKAVSLPKRMMTRQNVLKSQSLGIPGPNPTKSTEISLSFAMLSIDKETCVVALDWPAVDATTTETALIGDEAAFSGKMKHCFKLSMGTEQYVAKHFYEIGTGKDEVTMFENTSSLSWSADDLNMVIAKNFEITQCRIAKEVISSDGSPSPASGVVKKVFEAELSATHSIVWLLEPSRNSSVTH
ncbi:hypothetical protein B0H14DRAFT_2649224 [Mycena olivaceomarginata]|nr:hypothetical protein B0H14DRAFT_2649224 [Mycena olivaceomarginata]